MKVQPSPLPVPRFNLFDQGAQLALERIQFHVGSIVLKINVFEAKIGGTLHSAIAALDHLRVGQLNSFLHGRILADQQILVLEACKFQRKKDIDAHT